MRDEVETGCGLAVLGGAGQDGEQERLDEALEAQRVIIATEE